MKIQEIKVIKYIKIFVLIKNVIEKKMLKDTGLTRDCIEEI